jgi:quercetin dioxygenase-like cupin family protein
MQVARRLLIGPREGREVRFPGGGVMFKVFGEETGGLLAIVEHPIEPGALAPPHVHTNEDEYSYIVEGAVGVRVGDQEFTAAAGSYVLKPRGVAHTFWNAGPGPARLIEIICPAGLEHYFDEMAQLIPAAGPPDFDKIAALQQRYHNLRAHPEWVAELSEKYKVKVAGGRSREQDRASSPGRAEATQEGRSEEP